MAAIGEAYARGRSSAQSQLTSTMSTVAAIRDRMLEAQKTQDNTALEVINRDLSNLDLWKTAPDDVIQQKISLKNSLHQKLGLPVPATTNPLMSEAAKALEDARQQVVVNNMHPLAAAKIVENRVGQNFYQRTALDAQMGKGAFASPDDYWVKQLEQFVPTPQLSPRDALQQRNQTWADLKEAMLRPSHDPGYFRGIEIAAYGAAERATKLGAATDPSEVRIALMPTMDDYNQAADNVRAAASQDMWDGASADRAARVAILLAGRYPSEPEVARYKVGLYNDFMGPTAAKQRKKERTNAIGMTITQAESALPSLMQRPEYAGIPPGDVLRQYVLSSLAQQGITPNLDEHKGLNVVAASANSEALAWRGAERAARGEARAWYEIFSREQRQAADAKRQQEMDAINLWYRQAAEARVQATSYQQGIRFQERNQPKPLTPEQVLAASTRDAGIVKKYWTFITNPNGAWAQGLLTRTAKNAIATEADAAWLRLPSELQAGIKRPTSLYVRTESDARKNLEEILR